LNCNIREARIPGKVDTDWEGGEYSVKLEFSEDYPMSAPRVKFDPVIYHPNIFSSGVVCLSILNAEWKAGITVTEILMSLQWLLTHPNPDHVTDRPSARAGHRSIPAAFVNKLSDLYLQGKRVLHGREQIQSW
jgi:ubiquitin-protein ligase